MSACSPAAHGPREQPAAPGATLAHADVQRWLGLEVGTVASYVFTASYTERGTGGAQSAHWSCRIQERVVSAYDVDASGSRWTVVEVQRTIDRDACQRPANDWDLTPRDGREFVVIGGEAATYDSASLQPRARGGAVYRQTDQVDLGRLDESPLEYVVPLAPGTLWHRDPEARRQAPVEVIATLSRRVEQRVVQVSTPAGTFHDCWLIHTWASANTDDTSYVCNGIGEVRRVLERSAGSLQFTAQTVLVAQAVP